MKNRLLAQLPQHKTCLCSIYNPHLYIVDWKDYNKGAVEISGAQRNGHYKIFCVNGNTGFRNESRIFYFIHLQNEEAYERKESSSA